MTEPHEGEPSKPDDLTFVLFRLLPTDIAEKLAGEGASAQTIADLRWAFGLDKPLFFNLDGAGSLMYVGAENMRHPTAPDPTYAFPRDQWVCVRTHVVVDDTAGEVRSWVEHDDPVQVDLVTEAVGIDTLPDTPYLHFGLGVAWSSATQDALTLYFDEVGVSRTPIPCD